MEKTRCIIIGSGPAGYTAAIYLARAGVPAIVYEGLLPGGQLTQTTTIENFPGFPEGVEGFTLVDNMRKQAVRLGADIRTAVVKSIDLKSRPFVATIDNGDVIEADAAIIATGASPRYLGLDDEKRYAGRGVSTCATCDGFFYRKKRVAVVGGGDTACEEASYLSRLATDVYMIVRKDYLRASAAMRERVEQIPNIHILYNTNAIALDGDGKVQRVTLVHHKGTPQESQSQLDVDGFFLAIGHNPNVGFLDGQLELDETGAIALRNPVSVNDSTTATSVDGVFAAGDVADPRYRQAIAAAASGCRAALDVDRYLATL